MSKSKSLSNLKGHNNPRPPGDFPTHALVIYKGKYYDPSYGKSFNSFEEWKKASVAGFFNETKVKCSDGSMRHAWLIQKAD